MTDRDINARLNINEGSTSGIESVEDLQNELVRAGKDAAEYAKQTAAYLRNVEQIGDAGANVETLNNAFKQTSDQVETTTLQTAGLREELEKIQREKAPVELGKQFAQLAAETGSPRAALIGLQNELEQLGDITQSEVRAAAAAFDRELVTAIRRSEQASEGAANAARKQADQLERASRERFVQAGKSATFTTDNIGSISSFSSALATVTDSDAVRAIADITQVGEYVPRAADAARQFGEAVQKTGESALKGGGLVGGLASKINEAIPAFGAAGSGLAAIGLAAAPVAAVGLAGAAAVAEFNRRMEESSEVGKREADALLAGIDARTRAEIAVRQGDADLLQQMEEDATDRESTAQAIVDARKAERIAQRARLEEVRINPQEGDDFYREKATLTEIDAQLSTATTDLEKASSEVQGIAEVTNSAAAQTLFNEEKLLNERLNNATAQANAFRQVSDLLAGGLGLEGLNEEIEEVNRQIAQQVDYRKILLENGVAIGSDVYQQSLQQTAELEARFGYLNSTSARTSAIMNDATTATEKINQALKDAEVDARAAAARLGELLADFRDQRNTTRATRDLETSDRQQDQDIARKRAADDLDRQLESQFQAHQTNLIAIAARGNEAIASLREQLQARETESLQQIGQLRAKYNQDEQKALAAFQKQQLRAEEDYRRRRLQLEDQTEDDLFEARIRGNISEIAAAEKRRDTALKQLDDEEQLRKDRAQEDYDAQRQLAQEALDERIAQINAELEAFRLSTQDKIKATQDQTTAELAAARTAYDERLKLDADLRRIQETRAQEDSDRANTRRLRDQALQDAAAAASVAKQLEGIGTVEARAEAARLNELSMLESIEALALRIKGSVDTVGSTSPLGTTISNIVNGLLHNPYNSSSSSTVPNNLLPPPSSLASGNGRSTVVQTPVTVNVKGGELTKKDLENVEDSAFEGIRRAQIENRNMLQNVIMDGRGLRG